MAKPATTNRTIGLDDSSSLSLPEIERPLLHLEQLISLAK